MNNYNDLESYQLYYNVTVFRETVNIVMKNNKVIYVHVYISYKTIKYIISGGITQSANVGHI